MYQFLLNMWIMKKINEEYLIERTTRGIITEEQKQSIINSKQVQ